MRPRVSHAQCRFEQFRRREWVLTQEHQTAARRSESDQGCLVVLGACRRSSEHWCACRGSRFCFRSWPGAAQWTMLLANCPIVPAPSRLNSDPCSDTSLVRRACTDEPQKLFGASSPARYVQLLSLQPGWSRSRRAPRFLLLPVARRGWHQSKQPELRLQAALQPQAFAGTSHARKPSTPPGRRQTRP